MSIALSRLSSMVSVAAAAVIAAPATGGGVPVAMRDLREGDRLEAVRLSDLQAGPQAVTFNSPSILVFWAGWAPASVTAIKEIVAAMPRCPIQWDLVPISVEDPSPTESTAHRVDSIARAAGYQGPVWFDRNLELWRRWGGNDVPTIVVISYGGTVEVTARGWAAPVRERLLAGYLGASQDAIVASTPDSATVRCRRENVRSRTLWERGQGDSAIVTMRRGMSGCPGDADPWVFLAHWHRRLGDSPAAQAAADTAMAADSANPWGWVAAGEMASWRGDFERALGHARGAISCDSTFVPAWGLLAWSALELGDDSTATRAAAFLQRHNRHDPRLGMVRARLLEHKGDQRRAAAMWREAVARRLRLDRDPLTGIIRGGWPARP